MFIRVFSDQGRSEVLYNLDHTTKIEVLYSVKNEQGQRFRTDFQAAKDDSTAERGYRVHFGSDSITVNASPGDPVLAEIEKIYKSAIKA